MIWTILLALALALLAASASPGPPKPSAIAPILRIASAALLLAWLLARAAVFKRIPFSGALDSLVFFSFLYLASFGLKRSWKTHDLNWARQLASVLPPALALGAALFLPAPLKAGGPTPPILASPWILVHVPAFFIGYASLAWAAVLSTWDLLSKQGDAKEISALLSRAEIFLWIGLVTGAFWAHSAWGRFWAWDPKESWALASCLAVSAAGHLKPGRARSLFIVCALAVMGFTWIGGLFLLEGLHSYR